MVTSSAGVAPSQKALTAALNDATRSGVGAGPRRLQRRDQPVLPEALAGGCHRIGHAVGVEQEPVTAAELHVRSR